jgi:vitamin B12 transporter
MVLQHFFRTVLITGIIFSSGIVLGQEQKQGNQEKIYIVPDIIVSATKIETSYKHIASSVTVITAKDIQNSQHTTVLDILRTIPALDVVQAGPQGGQTSVFIRGANVHHTLVLIDGVVANDPISPTRAFDFATLTTDNIERIEILRGPQSILYGSNAMAGVISITTKKGAEKPAFSLASSAGTYKSFNNNVDFSGDFKKINYSFSLSHNQTNGISAAKLLNNRGEKDGYNGIFFSSRMGFSPTTNSSIDVIMRYLDTKADIDNSGGAFGDDPNNTLNQKQAYTRVQARIVALSSLWEQKFGISITDIERTNNNPIDTYHPTSDSRTVNNGGMTKFDWQNNLYISTDNILTISAETETETGTSETTGNYPEKFNKKIARTSGIYIQEQYSWKNLSASLGVRTDHHDKFGTVTTYRIAPVYFAEKTGTKVKATFGTGFRAPSLYQLYSIYGDEHLKPEKSRGWDAGIEQFLFNEKASIGITYFSTDYQQLIDFDFTTFTYKNYWKSASNGIEVFSASEIFGRLKVSTQYTYTIAKDKITKEPFIRRPKHKAGLNATYHITPKTQATVGIIAVGKRTDNDYSVYPANRITLGSYILTNIALEFGITSHLKLTGRIDNLFNKQYTEVLGYSSYGRGVFGGLKWGIK